MSETRRQTLVQFWSALAPQLCFLETDEVTKETLIKFAKGVKIEESLGWATWDCCLWRFKRDNELAFHIVQAFVIVFENFCAHFLTIKIYETIEMHYILKRTMPYGHNLKDGWEKTEVFLRRSNRCFCKFEGQLGEKSQLDLYVPYSSRTGTCN